jgi:hypothetical protein
MEKTFKHSGDLGDIIYSLPVIKTLGGGTLYLDITGGEDEPSCRAQCMDGKTKFNKISYDFIKPLIEVQPYIKEVKIYQKGQKIDYNLNLFRYKFADPNSRSKTKNLLDLHMEAFGLPEWDPNEPWLFVDNPIKLERKTIVTRSPRMQANFPWFQSNKFKFRDNAIFLGLPKEHEFFEWTFDIKIPYHPVKDALEIAKILKGAKALAANSTFILSVAIGLGTVPIVQEVEPHFPTTVFLGKTNMNYI